MSASSSSNTSTSNTGTPTHAPRNYTLPMSAPSLRPIPSAPLNPMASAPVRSLALSRAQPAGPSHSRTLVPNSSPPPDIDEMDIAMAEEAWDEPPEDMIPQTPPRRLAPLRKASSGVVTDRDSALAEFADFDVTMLDSSPPRSPQRHPIRAEASANRSAPQALLTTPKKTKAIRPPPAASPAPPPERWDREVEDKLRGLFKLPNFRKNQRKAVNAAMAGRDGESTVRE